MNLARDGPSSGRAVQRDECSKLAALPTLFDETMDLQPGIETDMIRRSAVTVPDCQVMRDKDIIMLWRRL